MLWKWNIKVIMFGEHSQGPRGAAVALHTSQGLPGDISAKSDTPLTLQRQPTGELSGTAHAIVFVFFFSV